MLPCLFSYSKVCLKEWKVKNRYFGCHVSVSGGFENGIKAGARLKVNTIQVHSSPPQRWNTKPYPEGYEEKFLALKKESCVEKVFFHGVYLINLANPDPRQFHLSKSSLLYYLDLMERIKGDGVIFHVGSLKHSSSEEEGYLQAAKGIDWILNECPGSARLLLEVAAGSGAVIGDKMEDLAAIYDKVKSKDRVAFALDTQHMWASGYNLDTEPDNVIEQVEKIFGLDKVAAIHLNDSKTEKGSRKDRHENLGEGLIGLKALEYIINHRKLRKIPFILETPALKEESTAAVEVETLRKIVK